MEPDGNEGVTIVLPATTDCEAEGAICTEDGRPLSNKVELTVSWPYINTPATGVPTIITARAREASVGETLTLDTSGISDADGMDNATFGYFWGRETWEEINGGPSVQQIAASWWSGGATYVVTAADEGKYIRVQVSFTDDAGNEESLMGEYLEVLVRASTSTDATLSGLALSGVNIGTFDPATTEYTASVGSDVEETTVTATVNDDGASYVVKLDGATDQDETVSLSVGSNVIAVEVTAEDGETTRAYTVAVTRAAPPPSTDAKLSGLTLSGVDFGPFDPATTNYTADVDNGVTETTVMPTTNDDGATYAVKLGGVTDSDGVVPLAEGSIVISVEVTAEDGVTTRTYTVTVTRAAAEPMPGSPPDAPQTPTGEVTGRGQAQLDWNDVEGAAYYQVRFWDADEWVELPTDEIAIVIDGSGAAVSNLPNGGFLYFSVRAGNAAGVSDWSEHLQLANPER